MHKKQIRFYLMHDNAFLEIHPKGTVWLRKLLEAVGEKCYPIHSGDRVTPV